MKSKLLILSLAILTLFPTAFSQTTAFNFQGRLNDGSSAANGSYDIKFKLFDSSTGGGQIGSTIDRVGLLVINGVFSTILDFGASAFTTGNRFLEISVRPAGSPNAHVILGARQQILAVPFASRAVQATLADTSSDASALGGVSALNYARLNFLNSGSLQATGNASFGNVAPNTRLTLSGGAPWTSNSWTASMNMQNASAMGWEANGSGQHFGVGQADGGLYFFRTYAGFGQSVPPANTDLRITDNGDIAQPIDRNGVVKAIVAITANGTIARCYNGVSGVTTSNCGITVSLNNQAGVYFIDFPFEVSNRFWIVSNDNPNGVGLDDVLSGRATLDSAQRLRVWTYLNGSRAYLPFHLFVF